MQNELRETLRKTVKELVKLGATELNMDGVIHTSPCFFAHRRRSDKLRLCIAFNTLNTQTLDEVYPIPRIDELIRKVSGYIIISIIDLRTAYQQARLSSRAKRLAGVLLPWGEILRFNVLTFRLKMHLCGGSIKSR